MAEKNITLVQGVVLDNNGGGGEKGTSIISSTPELIEKFNVGDTWLASKNAENYYNPKYIASLDTPHPVTKDNGIFWEEYKTKIPFENKFSFKIVSRFEMVNKDSIAGFVYYNNMVIITDGQLYVMLEPGEHQTDYPLPYYADYVFNVYNEKQKMNILYYINSSSVNLTFGNDEYELETNGRSVGVLDLDHEKPIYCSVQGSEVISSGIKGTKFITYITKGTATEKILEKDIANIASNLSVKYPQISDEIFFVNKKNNTDGVSFNYINKMNVKTGFISEDFINDTMLKQFLTSNNYTNIEILPSKNIIDINSVSNVMSNSGSSFIMQDVYSFKDLDNNITYSVSFRYSRSRGVEFFVFNSYGYAPIYSCYPIDTRAAISSKKLIKQFNNNGVPISILNNDLVFDNLFITDMNNKNSYRFNYFSGNFGDVNKNYVIANNGDEYDNAIYEIILSDEGDYRDIAYIPSMASIRRDLQYYMRIK